MATEFHQNRSQRAPVKRRGVLVLLGLSLLAGCSEPDRDINGRLILEVETPEGTKVGSSVVAYRFHLNSTFERMSGSTWYERMLRGEATVVDLGARGLLFALLRNDLDRPDSIKGPSPLWFRDAYKARGYDDGERILEMMDAIKRDKPRMELPPSRAPFLVRFRDIDDPATVEKVDPEHLDVSFGAGVRLKRATIEITSDPVTTGIEKRLGWLGQYYDKLFDGQRYQTIDATNRLANSLGAGDFKAGRN
jgi:hypothetical protein